MGFTRSLPTRPDSPFEVLENPTLVNGWIERCSEGHNHPIGFYFWGGTWIVSALEQENMMSAMSPSGIVNPLSILLFTVIWTAGMAAMMFPAISRDSC